LGSLVTSFPVKPKFDVNRQGLALLTISSKNAAPFAPRKADRILARTSIIRRFPGAVNRKLYILLISSKRAASGRINMERTGPSGSPHFQAGTRVHRHDGQVSVRSGFSSHSCNLYRTASAVGQAHSEPVMTVIVLVPCFAVFSYI